MTRDDPHAASGIQERSIRLLLHIGLRIKEKILSESKSISHENRGSVEPRLGEEALGTRYLEDLRRGIEDGGTESPDDMLGCTLCFDASYVLMRSGCPEESMRSFH